MELKQAMETATAELDVRPGFVGDVMAGARRRHTRKLVVVTAAVALLGGVTTGVVLTPTAAGPPDTGDHRLTAAPTGDLAGDRDFLAQALATWNNGQRQAWRWTEQVTDFTAPANVFWAANTPNGPAALVAQAVRMNGAPEARTVVGLVSGGNVVEREVDHGREVGLFQLGKERSTHVVLGLGEEVYWSVNPVRGPGNRLTRTWQRAEMEPGGAAVVVAKQSELPVFVRGGTPPASDDFTREPLRARGDQRPDTAYVAHPGLGWSTRQCASDPPPGVRWPPERPPSPEDDLRRLALLDYGVAWSAVGEWRVCAWLPDGRYAEVFESSGELYGALYQPSGAFSAPLRGGGLSRGTPVVVPLPDGQGTIVVYFGAVIGPQERPHAWLAPAGTREVAVRQGDSSTVVPLP
ncbi:hypothetical protein SAMN05216188_10911 [Lentzea xinjiangensis]|uniref:Uncharacterized protein n=1 Tax=Lentzea xinjiangensis TaxID=402600 RepID=A0A1H9MDR3_9PSEU|nr:hypothetical protein [Lentzea xinjiangensis]SER21856.1 hypothetical protein SAMN05216188_10911 [Lentzea xinjiangensis]